MKSKFAKFIDGTIGALLIFFAAFAIMRYFIPATDAAVFCAVTVTAGLCMLTRLRGKKKGELLRISKAADDMFFEFMFLPDNAPAVKLADALKAKGENAVRHGNGVYLNNTAAYCCFNNPPDQGACARLIAKAKHYSADKLIIISKAPPPVPQVDGIDIATVCGDDAYRLFASLNALPERKYAETAKRHGAFKNAFSRDKILRYLVLAFSFFFAAWVSRSVITFACSVLCAALAVISVAMTAVHAVKKRKENSV
ncbi:MAG: hypothetical protein K2M47_06920 [Clostridiales bacterium]|nr:hypothetical protein [Clostridiales bacterium]